MASLNSKHEMQLLELVECIGNTYGASNKAHSDIADCAMKLGFKQVTIQSPYQNDTIVDKVIRVLKFKRNLDFKIKQIQRMGKDCVVLAQVPFINCFDYSHKKMIELEKSERIISILIIHDIYELRNSIGTKQDISFINMLKLADVIISHNSKMTNYLVRKGLDRNRIVDLEIFDYILPEKLCSPPPIRKEVIIAGNLFREKCGYISELQKVNVTFNLFGPGYEEKDHDNVLYHGSFPSDQLPSKLCNMGGFGLIWDGDSIESCTGIYGNYLKYNNPHKLSLYLASGLPVLIWENAAEADFVIRNKVGYTISSLMDIEIIFNELNEAACAQLSTNVRQVANKLRNGFYGYNALEKSMGLLNI